MHSDPPSMPMSELQNNAGRTRNSILQTEATAKTAKTQRGGAFSEFWPDLAVLSVGVEGEKLLLCRRVVCDNLQGRETAPGRSV